MFLRGLSMLGSDIQHETKGKERERESERTESSIPEGASHTVVTSGIKSCRALPSRKHPIEVVSLEENTNVPLIL